MELLGAGGTVLLLGWVAAEGSLMSLLFKNRKGDDKSGSGSDSTAQLAYAQVPEVGYLFKVVIYC